MGSTDLNLFFSHGKLENNQNLSTRQGLVFASHQSKQRAITKAKPKSVFFSLMLKCTTRCNNCPEPAILRLPTLCYYSHKNET